ncbi:MAG: DUF1566 domain-containing protein [Fibromonadaceae bacterium]|jgi:hypothetical protein|nr:DUF1566 domain-containing protein [Fibromonadaceae bacterium]
MKKFLLSVPFLLVYLIGCGSDSDNHKIVFDTLMLQETDLSRDATWNTANSMCENSNVGSYNDWRLPTLAELGIIYSNKAVINGLKSGDYTGYWSSELCNETRGYIYNINDGSVGCPLSAWTYAVRCVRTISEIKTNAELKINNQSSYDLENIVWNNVDIGTIKRSFHAEKSVNSGNGYVFFTRTADKLNLRTTALVIVEKDKTVEFTITNNMSVTEITNSENITTLNAIEATPPVFGSLMLQGKDLVTSASWSSANAMCKDSRIAGYDDWRLPTRSELGIFYGNKTVISGLVSSTYWSSEIYSTIYDSCYFIDIDFGAIKNRSCTNDDAVRCVRTID